MSYCSYALAVSACAALFHSALSVLVLVSKHAACLLVGEDKELATN